MHRVRPHFTSFHSPFAPSFPCSDPPYNLVSLGLRCFTRIVFLHFLLAHSAHVGRTKKTALQLMRVQRSSFDFEKDLIMLQQVLQRFQLLLLQLLHLQRLQLQPVLQPMQLSFPSRAQQFCR